MVSIWSAIFLLIDVLSGVIISPFNESTFWTFLILKLISSFIKDFRGSSALILKLYCNVLSAGVITNSLFAIILTFGVEGTI